MRFSHSIFFNKIWYSISYVNHIFVFFLQIQDFLNNLPLCFLNPLNKCYFKSVTKFKVKKNTIFISNF